MFIFNSVAEFYYLLFLLMTSSTQKHRSFLDNDPIGSCYGLNYFNFVPEKSCFSHLFGLVDLFR